MLYKAIPTNPAQFLCLIPLINFNMQLFSPLLACFVAVAVAQTTSTTTKSTVVTVRLFSKYGGQALTSLQSTSTLPFLTTSAVNTTTSHISTTNSTVTLSTATSKTGNTSSTTTSGPAKVTANAAVRAYGPSVVAFAGVGGLLAAFL